MAWLWWGVACAVGMGGVDLLSKRALREFPPAVVGTARLGFAIPVLALPPLIAGCPPLSPLFWGVVAVMVPLEILAFVCLLRALQVAPLGETVPFLSLSPLFTVVASWLILRERVTVQGFLGICIIVVGGYLLYGHELRHGYLGPFRAMIRSRGTRLMVVVAALYSVTSSVGKWAIQQSSAFVFPGLYFAVLSVAFVLLQVARGARPAVFWQAVRRRPWLLIGLGVVDGLTFLIHAVGVLLAPVAYFVGVKRLSAVISVLLGGLVFREPHLRTRLVGASGMVVGVLLLTLGG